MTPEVRLRWMPDEGEEGSSESAMVGLQSVPKVVSLTHFILYLKSRHNQYAIQGGSRENRTRDKGSIMLESYASW